MGKGVSTPGVGKGDVGTGAIGGGFGGSVGKRSIPGVGANVLLLACADTIAMEAELIRMDVIESFIFD